MSEKQNTIIESLGVYLPPKEVSSKEIMKQCRQKLKYPMERLTGISSRHMLGMLNLQLT